MHPIFMIRKLGFVMLFMVLAATLAYGLNASLSYFRAEPSAGDVKLVWEMNSENGVNAYEIHRKASTEANFRKLGTVPANGSRRYEFTDPDLYKTAGITLHYKLVIDGTPADQSFQTTFVQMPSAVERSWGSIKSMFR